jgi:hypothetical protein
MDWINEYDSESASVSPDKKSTHADRAPRISKLVTCRSRIIDRPTTDSVHAYLVFSAEDFRCQLARPKSGYSNTLTRHANLCRE